MAHTLTAVDVGIRTQIDHLATGFTNAEASFSAAAKDIRHLIDDVGDIPYEDLLGNSLMTELSATLLAMDDLDISEWIRLHESYLLLVDGRTSVPYFDDWLTDRRLRVPQKFAEVYLKSKNNQSAFALSPANIFTKGVYSAGTPINSKMHLYGTSTDDAYVASDGELDITEVGVAPILAVNMEASQTSGAVFNGICEDDTEIELTLALSNASQYTKTFLGEQDHTGTLAVGATVITVADTSSFAEDQKVMILDESTMLLTEIGVIDSISENTSITLTDGILNEFADASLIIPLFKDAEFVSATGTGVTKFYASPDRPLSL